MQKTEDIKQSKLLNRLKELFRRNFLAGLLVLIPVFVTVYVFIGIGQLMEFYAFFKNDFLNIIVNVAITMVVILLFGGMARNYFGHKIVSYSESALVRIPIAKTIYLSIKQLLSTFITRDSMSFRKVVLVEYPRKGIYSLAFVTGQTMGELKQKIEAKENKEAINIFVPTTPNPTSGFYLIVPAEDLIELDISTEEAFKIIISAGMLNESKAEELIGSKKNKDKSPS